MHRDEVMNNLGKEEGEKFIEKLLSKHTEYRMCNKWKGFAVNI